MTQFWTLGLDALEISRQRFPVGHWKFGREDESVRERV